MIYSLNKLNKSIILVTRLDLNTNKIDRITRKSNNQFIYKNHHYTKPYRICGAFTLGYQLKMQFIYSFEYSITFINPNVSGFAGAPIFRGLLICAPMTSAGAAGFSQNLNNIKIGVAREKKFLDPQNGPYPSSNKATRRRVFKHFDLRSRCLEIGKLNGHFFLERRCCIGER